MYGIYRRTKQLFSLKVNRPNDIATVLVSKKPVEYDYVALDVSGLIGGAYRLAKNCRTEDRRIKEVTRHVWNNINQLLTDKIHARKGIFFAFDGAECMTKAAIIRDSLLSARNEIRLRKLPGAPISIAVEDRLVRSMPNAACAGSSQEILISGNNVFGCVEEKMAAWMLDLACKETYDANKNSLCLVGGVDLFLNALASTPYYNITTVVQHNSGLKQMKLLDVLRWLGLDSFLDSSEQGGLLPFVRTDVLFLFLLCDGCSATELEPVERLLLFSLLESYNKVVFGGKGVVSDPKKDFLFSEGNEQKLDLNVPRLIEVLVGCRGGYGGVNDKKVTYHKGVEEFLSYALESHHILCFGSTPSPNTIFPFPRKGDASGPLVNLNILVEHLLYMSQQHQETLSVRVPPWEKKSASDTDEDYKDLFWSEDRPPTAAEYTLLCHKVQSNMETLFHLYLGKVPKNAIVEKICNSDINSAREFVQDCLSFANVEQPHRSLCYSPSYCWVRTGKGPNGAYRLDYVDIGVTAKQKCIRSVRNREAKGQKADIGPSLDVPVLFTDKGWGPVAFPYSETKASSAVVACPPDALDFARSEKLKVLTWNVMFDRYSNQPTPLGMPGIDWCSPKRYPVLSKVLEAEEADVVGLQEVEIPFAQYLMEQPWCRENYVVSCPGDSDILNPWGVLLLIRRRSGVVIERLRYFNLPAWSGHSALMPMTSLHWRGALVHVAAIHLLAPFTKNNVNARTKQDDLLRRFSASNAFAPLSDPALIMGDFNDWPGNEFLMPGQTGYVECWPLLHPNDLGKTMDESNAFCKLKIEEIFFGRSDKVFLRAKGRLKPFEAHLVGTKSVNEVNQNNEAPDYLFPSDHYGVSMNFTLM